VPENASHPEKQLPGHMMRFSLQEHCSSEASACQSTVLALKGPIEGQPDRLIGTRAVFPILQCSRHGRGLIIRFFATAGNRPPSNGQYPRTEVSPRLNISFLDTFPRPHSNIPFCIFNSAFSPHFQNGANTFP
jgi:hypothetical protein